MSDDPARKTNGAVAYGKTVWSWLPLLQSSFLRRRLRPNRVQDVANPRSDGDNKEFVAGESAP